MKNGARRASASTTRANGKVRTATSTWLRWRPHTSSPRGYREHRRYGLPRVPRGDRRGVGLRRLQRPAGPGILSLAARARAGVSDAAGIDFVVYPRGKGPSDGEVAYRVRIIGERDTAVATDLGGCVLAVVDEESEVTSSIPTDARSPGPATPPSQRRR